MTQTTDHLLTHLLDRLHQVQLSLGREADSGGTADVPLADLLDSMGLVEYVAVLADDCGIAAEAIEQSVQHRFGTCRQLAEALVQAGLALPAPWDRPVVTATAAPTAPVVAATGWLSAPVLCLPETVQPAETLDALLERPRGWLARHAGIQQRHIWAVQEPLTVAAECGLNCLSEAGVLPEEVDALLVLSEAPPLLAGLGAALHHRLNLRPQTVALELGGACTGFLSALWLGQSLLERLEMVLILVVEAPSWHLPITPGPAGEAAALFGDAAAACLLSRQAASGRSLALQDVDLRVEGKAGGLLQVRCCSCGGAEIHMDGMKLAGMAVRTMAQGVLDLLAKHQLDLADVPAILAHGGNGRLPGLLARQLGLPSRRVWSQTEVTGNLGSASLLAAWAARQEDVVGPVVWAAVGAGLTGAWALTTANGR
jgi:3-oxoacyl-[acyl-carrier-protein] synthase-3